MSSAALHATNEVTLAAWETEQQVKFARLDGRLEISPRRGIFPASREASRKHPVLATDGEGSVILVWTEGTGWQKGGAVAWQVFEKSGNAIPGYSGRVDGVPVWSFAAVYARPAGGFVIVY
jgi:hypothetical protein